jgi:hypothetical protein
LWRLCAYVVQQTKTQMRCVTLPAGSVAQMI